MLKGCQKVRLFTCPEECDGLQVGKLLVVHVHLGHGPDVLLDLADGARHLAYALRAQLVLVHRSLQLGHDGAQDAGQVHGGGALRHAKHEQVGPGVADEADLGVKAEMTTRLFMSLIKVNI